MGYRYSLRFAVMGIAAALCSMTLTTTAPAFHDSGGTMATTMSPFEIVLSYDDVMPASLFVLPVIKEQRIASDHQAFRPMAIKERASRSAVRPTALSGWRSGRIRTLAA